MNRIFALECLVYFLNEKRTELYEQYYSGASQLKNALGTMNDLQNSGSPARGDSRWGLGRALPGLERRGA